MNLIGFDINTYKNRRKRYCLNCNKELKSGQKKFCCKSCSASYNNKGRVLSDETKIKISNSLSENKSKEYSPDPKYCKNCGKLITKSGNIFCDSNCCNEYRYKTSILD